MLNTSPEKMHRRLACAALAAASSLPSFGAVIHVYELAPAGGDGSSWLTAMNNLQTALASAQPGDQIWVAQGVYKPHPTSRNVSFELKNGVELYGSFEGFEESLLQRDSSKHNSVLSGEINGATTSDNSYHVVRATNVNASAVLDGFAITAGQAPTSPWINEGTGGGMLVEASLASGPTIRNCVFSNNSAVASGGALFIIGGNMRIEGCMFYGNRLQSGNGSGGAIGTSSVTDASVTIVNCVFAQNFTLSSSGGALYAYGGDILNVFSSTFHNNTALTGSIIAGNPAVANFRNCIFSGSGGASAYFAVPAVNVQYSVVPGGMTGEGNVATAATFLNTAAALFRLVPGSSAIDIGNNAMLPPGGLTKDYDGNPRILNDRIDAGAFEFVAVTCPGDLNKDGIVDDADFVRFVVAYNNFLDRTGDLNSDAITDDADFVVFASAYDAFVCS